MVFKAVWLSSFQTLFQSSLVEQLASDPKLENRMRNAGRRKKEVRKISSSSQSEFEDSGPEEGVNMSVNHEQMEVEEDDDDDDVDEEGANGDENRKGNSESEEKTSNKTYGKVTGLNLEGIHARYEGVLRILQDRKCSFAKAMDKYGIPRNTLRDFLGISELRILDEERYKIVVGTERKCTGKPSAKVIERGCRYVLAEYKAQSQRLKEEKKFLPFFPAESFYK